MKKQIIAMLALSCVLGGSPSVLANTNSVAPVAPSIPLDGAAEPVLGTADKTQSNAGPRLFAVPVLEPGKAAWVSIYDQAGKPLAAAELMVNQTPFKADNFGQATFTVPQSDKVVLSVTSGGNKTEYSYTKTPAGFLVSEPSCAEAIDRLEGTVVTNELAPAVTYAPAAIEVSQPFVVVGKNLSGKADEDHVQLDGYDADVFSGSTVSLLCSTPKRISLGPLKEIYVTANGENSNTLEVDICKVDATAAPAQSGGMPQMNVRVAGSNVPCLIEMDLLSKNAVSFNNKRLGSRSTFVTPGGESNVVALTVHDDPQSLMVETHLVADSPWSPDDRTTFGDTTFRKVIKELNRAEVIRLKRRMIALESRINEEQANRTTALASGKMSTYELDKSNAQIRTLANRRHRLNAMVVARQVVFQSMGGTDEEYQQAMDEATGGNIIAIEKTIAPILGIPLLARSTPAAGLDFNGSNEDLAAMLRQREQDFEKSVAVLQKMWSKMPTKLSHSRRLAPPPAPYLPSLAQLGPAIDYTRVGRLSMLPPPPPELKQLQARHAHKTTKRTSSTKRTSRKRKHR